MSIEGCFRDARGAAGRRLVKLGNDGGGGRRRWDDGMRVYVVSIFGLALVSGRSMRANAGKLRCCETVYTL